MVIWRIIAAASIFLCATIPARAEVTGNGLREYCDFPEGTQARVMCLGYISGTIDTIRGFDKTLKLRLVCEPRGVTGEQLISMIIKYLQDHPEKLHFVASSLIWEMMTKAFPCKS